MSGSRPASNPISYHKYTKHYYVAMGGKRIYLDSDKDEALKKYHRIGLGFEELNAYLFKDSSAEEQKQSEENAKLIEKLVAFCIENWDNEFMHELQDELWGQRGYLEDQKEPQDKDEGGR